MNLHAPYPRFVHRDIEELFIHWLHFNNVHSGSTLKKTSTFCYKCLWFKDCIDFGVMKQLNCLLAMWEKKLRGSDISSIVLGYMTEEEAHNIYKQILFHSHDGRSYSVIARKQIEEMIDKYFNSILHQDELEISVETGHYLPFIIHCVAQFRTLAVRYNEIIMNITENYYYMIAFVLTCFHLNGILAFSPGIVKFMWSELLPESVIAWFYHHNDAQLQ